MFLFSLLSRCSLLHLSFTVCCVAPCPSPFICCAFLFCQWRAAAGTHGWGRRGAVIECLVAHSSGRSRDTHTSKRRNEKGNGERSNQKKKKKATQILESPFPDVVRCDWQPNKSFSNN
ncbi:hypothetical protein B0T17DRAFT_168659 [Bombardia bombarda]|uniref:Secreted protein n=1 Tax=Bombardia bombarda TaxID=252184 RepID=A0AA39X7P8_9PEZI|nr:hypothetical protein B0T17DRAFT_168659 [Bombardia bombarda]